MRITGDKWPGDFYAGDHVKGMYGNGVVATRDYCLGNDHSQRGKDIRNAGIREGLVPVVFDDVGCFWQSPLQLKKDKK